MSVATMTTPEIVLRLFGGIALILMNAFFVAVEFGLTRARQYTKEDFVDEGSKGLERAWKMTEELEIYLTSCQVGISATSIALGVIAEPALVYLFDPIFSGTSLAGLGLGVLLSFIVINLVHLTHGEQTPTYLGVEKSKMVCKYGATPLYWYTRVIRPVINFGDGIAKLTLKLFGIEMTSSWLETGEETIKNRSELRDRLNTMLDQQEISKERKDEVLATLDADKISVEEEMVDKDDMITLSTKNSHAENKKIIEEEPHTRYPLIGDSLDDLVGIIYMSDLARTVYGNDEDIDLEDVASPVMTLDAKTSISVAIDQFQAEQQEMAFVIDEGSDVVGLITVTDALESLVGEIEDPMD